jgi:hypothetical protein
VRVTKREVAETLAYLKGIYAGLIPSGQTELTVHSWLITLGDANLEPGDLLTAAVEWARGDEHEYAPKPGQLMAIIRDEQARRKRTEELSAWRQRGCLVVTSEGLSNQDGDLVDEHGNVIPEIGEGKPKDQGLDEIVQRITGRMKAK